ncbi:MAG: proton-conducting transporter membrane subunit, partial [Candidatus Subteraquimicrobiales bacterium]|nr:proton-conducting transporter membrane subunit [Candidatus Subteraquimicrobiales bacterium]
DISKMLPLANAPHVASVALTLFILGFAVKAALFPLHIWLPDAHALAPSPVSAILSGLTVKMGIIGLVRMFFIIYGVRSALNISLIMQILAWLAALTIVLGAFFAFFQNDIKMMLAYSTISNIGYIVLGLSVAPFDKSPYGYALVGSLVHIFNHAMVKILLFLCAGAIIHQTGLRKLSDLNGIGKKMPITLAAMSIGVVSIVGIPPTCGFTCKWFIALGAMEAGKPFFAVTLLFGALFIFAYYMRIVNAAYFREPTEAIANVKEAPMSMTIPIIILAAGCLIFGAGTFGYIPLEFIKPAALALLGR